MYTSVINYLEIKVNEWLAHKWNMLFNLIKLKKNCFRTFEVDWKITLHKCLPIVVLLLFIKSETDKEHNVLMNIHNDSQDA